MNKEQEYKSHHFVPVTYQKRWTKNLNGKILIYNKDTKKIFSDIPKNQAQKKNFYTMQQSIESVDPKFLEKLIFPLFEQQYAEVMSRTFDIDNLPTLNEDINKLVNFIIVQASRTKKSKEIQKWHTNKMQTLNGEIIDEEIKKYLDDPNISLAGSIMKFLPSTINKATFDILVAPKNENFLTSDHPSSTWFKEGLDFFSYEYSIIDLLFNDRYILCPLSPKYCGMVRFCSLTNNGMFDENKNFIKKNIPYQFISLEKEDVLVINKMVIRAADKIILFSTQDDIRYI